MMSIAGALFCGSLVTEKESCVDVSVRVSMIAVGVVMVDGDAVEVVMSSVDV